MLEGFKSLQTADYINSEGQSSRLNIYTIFKGNWTATPPIPDHTWIRPQTDVPCVKPNQSTFTWVAGVKLYDYSTEQGEPE